MDRCDMQDKKIDRLVGGHNYLDGERLLDNQDLCLLLKVSAKTLQRYRKKGILPYLTLDGRCYYRESDGDLLLIATYNPTATGRKPGSLYVYSLKTMEKVKEYVGICEKPVAVAYKFPTSN